MEWWSSVVNGVIGVGDYVKTSLVNGAVKGERLLNVGTTWVWETVPLVQFTARFGLGVLRYTSNTFFEALNHTAALRTALPALWIKPDPRDILNGMAYIAVYDLLPLAFVGYVNNQTQSYVQKVEPFINHPLYAAEYGALQIANYGTQALFARLAIKTVVHSTVLTFIGPSAFKANSPIPARTECLEEECSNQRLLKGFLREPIILLINDLTLEKVRSMPNYGELFAFVMGIILYGRAIARAANPDICERHKLPTTMKESTLVFGLAFWLTSWLLNNALKTTVGEPSYMTARTLNIFLTLFHINLAAHTPLNLVTPDQATFRYDPFDVYEAIWRFIVDSILTGVMVRIPIDFKPIEGAPPLFSLSESLQSITQKLNSDKEIEHASAPGFLTAQFHRLKKWFLPTVVQDFTGFANDPFSQTYWQAIRRRAISIIAATESIGKGYIARGLAKVPTPVAEFGKYIYGMPRNATKTVLMLREEKDFWQFLKAFREWFERHNVLVEIKVHVALSSTSLHGMRPLLEAPKVIDQQPVIAVDELKPANTSPPVATTDDLKRETTSLPVTTADELKPDDTYVVVETGIFARKKRGAPLVDPTLSAQHTQ